MYINVCHRTAGVRVVTVICADDAYLKCAKKIYERFLNFSGLQLTNDTQKAAVEAAIFRTFTLIQGPPGTGKTVTVVRLAALFVHLNEELDSKYGRNNSVKRQVMICGPSNKSVDVVAGSKLIIQFTI